ncbi:MAG: hypothetical protein K2G67_04525 [Muribaculaceae bacterium]|nr:hypothetical protein [Muribaculaceae bacterium]
MIDALIIIGILAMAGIAFNIRNLREIDDRHSDERTEQEIEDPELKRTIKLIGERAYKEMTQRIDVIMNRHSDDRNRTISLTCGPDTFDGAHELHGLLPGQALKLVSCRSEGVDTIDVYFNGVRIGRLALNEVQSINSLLTSNKIVGAYVAEQNCFRKIGSHQMDIIIFYKPRKVEKKESHILKSGLEIFKNKKEATKNICMN